MNTFGKIDVVVSDWVSDVRKRVILFDPSEVYSRIKIDNLKRHQSISLVVMFPQFDERLCACGCGQELKGKQRRWASEQCSYFAGGVFQVIAGYSDYIKKLMHGYLSDNCAQCKCEPYCVETANGSVAGIHVEHILAVKNGGGGCWLGNYQFLCHRCHRVKTVSDNAYRNKYKPLPISTMFD